MFTLIEYAKGTQDEVLRGVIEVFAEEPLLANIPFRPIQGNALSYNKESVLPGIAFRGINQAYTESVGVIVPATENLKILGGDADTDLALIKWFGEGRRSTDIAQKAKAARLYFLKMLIDGDESTDPLQFDGLNRRIGTGSQHFHANASTGAAGANLVENTMTVLADLLDGTPSMYIMGKALKRQVDYLFKGSTLFGFTDPNYFGRRTPTFNGIPIQILDKDNSGNEILGFDETEGTDSGICASMYAVVFGVDSDLCGIQTGPPEGADKGTLETKNVKRYNIEWLVGLATFKARCIARVQGITKISGVY
jgi:hypothetical protein